VPRAATLLAALLALTSHSPAQTPAAATYRIAGHIVSAADGRPLQHASVRMLETGDYKLIGSTTAAEDGAFSFPNLKAGTYVIEGAAPGYLTARYDEHTGYNTAIITGAGVDTESLVFKLAHKASISGRVADQNGDPIRGANITVYRDSRDNILPAITRYSSASTDDTGAYELIDLPPGRYFLSVTATPWYATRPQPLRESDGLGVVPRIDPSLDVAYPITFYPDVTDSSQASPIVLRAGDQPEINFRLNAVSAMSISITSPEDHSPILPGQANEQIARNRRMQDRPQYQVFKKVFDSLEQVPSDMRVNETGFNLVGLPPGQYVLREFSQQPNHVDHSINVNLYEAALQLDPARGQELANLNVELKPPEGSKSDERLLIDLLRAGSTQVINPQGANKGVFEFRGIDPGDYDVRVYLGNNAGFVASLLSAGKPLPTKRLHLTAGSNISITVIAAQASGTLRGFAKKDGKPAPGAMILLLPADPAERTRQTWRDQSDLDGSSQLTAIPPGKYRLLAIQDAWELDLQREGALDHYLPLATPITVPGTGDTALKLPDPLIVQPR